MKIKKLTLKDNSLPAALASIPDPPKQLFVSGDNFDALMKLPRLAVVGSRKITPYGRGVTRQLVENVSRAGLVIISGLAIGLDGLAHQAALAAAGPTIAVLPCGLDRIYPSTHYRLAKQILEQGGALVSEYAAGIEPYPSNFIARNRLISGLSQAVLIPEAAERSGSLHTANFALEQGREVLAVPGNINSPTSIGTNNLIRTGAAMITSAVDIFEAMGLPELINSSRDVPAQNAAEQAILTPLSQGITDSEELLSRSGLEAAVFNQTLTMLEITGRIKSLGAGHWSI